MSHIPDDPRIDALGDSLEYVECTACNGDGCVEERTCTLCDGRSFAAGLRSPELRDVIASFTQSMQRTVEFAGMPAGVAYLLESWMAFEALAGDLWAKGVDHGPKEVMARILLYSQWEKPDEGVNFQMLPTLGSDAKTHPGSFLRETGKASFQKLHSARKYFGIAFGNDAENAFDRVQGGDIWLLSAYRNAITHCAGKADRHFIKRMERFPEFHHIKLNDELVFDGAFVKRLRLAAMHLADELVHMVDDLLCPKPTSTAAQPSSFAPSSTPPPDVSEGSYPALEPYTVNDTSSTTTPPPVDLGALLKAADDARARVSGYSEEQRAELETKVRASLTMRVTHRRM